MFVRAGHAIRRSPKMMSENNGKVEAKASERRKGMGNVKRKEEGCRLVGRIGIGRGGNVKSRWAGSSLDCDRIGREEGRWTRRASVRRVE